MSFKIREAQPKDMESVLKLITELAVFEKEPDAVEISVEDLLENGFKENPAFYIYVAEMDGEIVGMALFYYRFSTWAGISLHLEDLIVTQQYRQKGIGKALYDKVLNFAVENDINRVEWVVLDWNTPAVDFYKSTGATVFEEWNICQMPRKKIEEYLLK
ncbi:GNAT family N-acetyltransferase [Aureibaculum sp. 2210JD6-5]|uniref:GNAT family N-acetyltransferase n=1 Tax=Aureibaculum sp. 2210JD6-5 TaxID=3103957 RepID=UPI002AADA1DF|nr:GNAT family N-acetyltransferase [Aureibaculum sp. 2210JD6-5]MDY7396421.1 GNAT family N-acetyltransferase [Aureibaculum sp. 2210JD6-5]